MPGKPTTRTRVTKIDNKDFTWNVLRRDRGNEVYVVAYTDISAKDIARGSDGFLKVIQTELLPKLNLQSLSDSGNKIYLGSYPERQFLVQAGVNRPSIR